MPHLLTSLAVVDLVPLIGPSWLDAEKLIASFGDYALIGIVVVLFIETGLLFPLLPGDSLLFTAGLLAAQQGIRTPLWLLVLMFFGAAFLGDQAGYLIGRKAGPKIFDKPDSRFFKRTYVDQTYAYFDRYGGRTIIVARFVPFVRTFAPVAAGVGRMRYARFVRYNAVGALLWGAGVTVLGYYLGQITVVRDNIEPILILIVLLSLIPVMVELHRARRGKKAGSPRDERDADSQGREQLERDPMGWGPTP